MRSATDIVEGLAREILGSAETLDSIERRASEFAEAARRAPEGSMAREIAGSISLKLGQMQRLLTVSRFRL